MYPPRLVIGVKCFIMKSQNLLLSIEGGSTILSKIEICLPLKGRLPLCIDGTHIC